MIFKVGDIGQLIKPLAIYGVTDPDYVGPLRKVRVYTEIYFNELASFYRPIVYNLGNISILIIYEK